MKITSKAFKHMGTIPQKYTCEGEGVNPPLTFIDVPEKTVSLVFIMDDPDVPKVVRADKMWNHWIIWNINPKIKSVIEGEDIDGMHGITTSDTLEYVPPCPPDKEHRYFFKLYALDDELSLMAGSTKKDVENAMKNHIISEAYLIGLYCKKENK